MSKRSREDDVCPQRPQRIPRRGIGPSKCIKMDGRHFTDKENVPSQLAAPLPDIEKERMLFAKKGAIQSTRQALKPKVNNYQAIRAAHPISENVVKPNLYDHENWIAQQQELFTSILNEILESETSHPTSWDQQGLERMRALSFQYYQSDSFQSIVQRISSSFTSRRLTLSHQSPCFRDLDLKSAVMDLFVKTYASPWLSLGLELVTGRICHQASRKKTSLIPFIDAFILGPIDIPREMTDEDLRDQRSVQKLLVLIYALDNLKIMLGGSSLFLEHSTSKSSLEVAQRLSKLCLAGEGDFGRRLHSITKSQLMHVQYPLDDFTYAITNLAVDLRDGVRLTKLVEVFTGLPQRIHNLSVALAALQAEGISLTQSNGDIISASDIEVGNREKTLFVVWCMLSRWRLSRYLQNVDLKGEIDYLKKILLLRKERLPSVQVLENIENQNDQRLLEWVALVCSVSGRTVHNVTTSFISYEPFYCLLRYYFPNRDVKTFLRETRHLSWILARSHAKSMPSDLPDVRVIMTASAILASRVLMDNDRREAAIKIQRAFRAFLNRDNDSSNRTTRAAILIQRAFRRYRKQKFRALVASTIAVQARARGYLFRLAWKRRLLHKAFIGYERGYMRTQFT